VLGELEPCLIGIEASTGAFYWQRQFEKLGHTVKIMAPQYVKPFVRRQKNVTPGAESSIGAATITVSVRTAH
jgi:transposase